MEEGKGWQVFNVELNTPGGSNMLIGKRKGGREGKEGEEEEIEKKEPGDDCLSEEG